MSSIANYLNSLAMVTQYVYESGGFVLPEAVTGAEQTPLTMILETIGTLAISGLPFTSGFIGKTLLATYSTPCTLIILSFRDKKHLTSPDKYY